MLGHASAAMTLDVYARLFEDELDAVADRMGAAARATAGLVADSLRPRADVVDLRDASRRPGVVGRVGLEPTTGGL